MYFWNIPLRTPSIDKFHDFCLLSKLTCIAR